MQQLSTLESVIPGTVYKTSLTLMVLVANLVNTK